MGENVTLGGGALGSHTISVKPIERDLLGCDFELNLIPSNVPTTAVVVAGHSLNGRNVAGGALDLISFQLIGEDGDPIADPR